MSEVLLSHTQHIARISEEHIAALNILCHILVLTLLEVLQFLLIVSLNPTCLMQMNRLPTALGIVLVLQAILDNLELQLTDGTHDATTIELVDEQLCHTLVHQLLQSLLELLALHWVVVLDILEEQRRERWQTTEVQLLALGERVANLEDAVVGQTYDVAWISLVDGALALRHELCGRRETDGLAQSYVQVRLIAHKLARTNLAEGNT